MSRYVVQAGWDDVPHLDDATKKEMLSKLSPHQRDARSKGIPSLGSGAVWPVPEDDFKVTPFNLPPYWPRIYGMDVGWRRTAAVWGAHDRETDTLYLYSEHYRGEAEPSVHASGIRARGDWIPGMLDTAARGRSQSDGQQLWQKYTDQGLELVPAVKAVEAGVLSVMERLSTGRLKVFSTLEHWFYEFRLYRRDDKGRIVKENDHLMDSTRYLVMGIEHAITKPITRPTARVHIADAISGY